jgi:hypothetical protein
MDMDIQTVSARIEALILELRQLQTLVLDGVPEFPQEAGDRLASGKCLTCGKPLDGRVLRGNHERCHKRVIRRIRDGELTESEAITAGLLTMSSSGGRPRILDDRLHQVIAEGTQDIADAVSDHRKKKAKSATKTSKPPSKTTKQREAK